MSSESTGVTCTEVGMSMSYTEVVEDQWCCDAGSDGGSGSHRLRTLLFRLFGLLQVR